MAQNVSVTVTENGARIGAASQTVDEESAFRYASNVPASTTDRQVPVSVDFSELKLVFIHSDAAVTVETDDSAAPDQTFSLAADQFIFWCSSMPTTCPITTDFEHIYLTTGAIGSDGANVTIILVHDEV